MELLKLPPNVLGLILRLLQPETLDMQIYNLQQEEVSKLPGLLSFRQVSREAREAADEVVVLLNYHASDLQRVQEAQDALRTEEIIEQLRPQLVGEFEDRAEPTFAFFRQNKSKGWYQSMSDGERLWRTQRMLVADVARWPGVSRLVLNTDWSIILLEHFVLSLGDACPSLKELSVQGTREANYQGVLELRGLTRLPHLTLLRIVGIPLECVFWTLVARIPLLETFHVNVPDDYSQSMRLPVMSSVRELVLGGEETWDGDGTEVSLTQPRLHKWPRLASLALSSIGCGKLLRLPPGLTSLSLLSNSSLTGLRLPNPDALRNLDIMSCEALKLPNLCTFTNLESLHLSKGYPENADFYALHSLKRLSLVELDNVSWSPLTGLTSLVSLSMRELEDFPDFSGCQSLQDLELDKLTKSAIDWVLALPCLRTIDLGWDIKAHHCLHFGREGGRRILRISGQGRLAIASDRKLLQLLLEKLQAEGGARLVEGDGS